MSPATQAIFSRTTPECCSFGLIADDVYLVLTGWRPADAAIDDDDDFDTHVFGSLIAVAASEGGFAHEHVGLSGSEFRRLLDRRFPGTRALFCVRDLDRRSDDDEVAMVRDLLLQNRSADSDESEWLAAMIARRAIEPNHLWEDLGLRDRTELTRLLNRHFAPLASRNTNNMRWKRFFYRMMCEDDGFVMCSTPVCTACSDFDRCFGEETGEGRLAQIRRAAATPLS
jgi:nitrogen fixation protein NifQ